MPLSSVDIAANSNKYSGSSWLGNSIDTPLNISTRPIDELMAYTYQFNKEQREVKRADEKEKVAQLGQMTAIDWENAIPKERPEALKIVDDLREYAKTYAAKPNTTTSDKLAWMGKLNEAKRKVAKINSRYISYGGWNEKIAAAPSQAMKDLLTKERDAAVNSTTIEDSLPITQEYKVDDFKIPDAKSITLPAQIRRNANDIELEDHTIWNQEAALAEGTVLALQLDKPINQNTPEGARASLNREGNLLVHGTDILNGIFNSNKEANGGQLNEDKLPTPAKGIVDLARTVNAYAVQKNADIASGKYGNNLKPYKIINWEDGIQPDELAMMGSFSTWKGDKTERKVIQTNDQIEKARLAETARNNNLDYALGMAKLDVDKKELKLRENQFKATQKGSETQVNGAMQRANRMMDDLKKIAGDDSIITPDEIRKLNVEQRKYLGIEKPVLADNGDPKGKPVLTPLSFDEDGREFAIELIGDEVRVIKGKDENGKKLLKSPTGKLVGEWDNSRSTNKYNIATNVLNEELSNAGSKELNSYWGVDVTGGNTSFTNNSSSEKSSSGAAVGRATTTKQPVFSDDVLKRGAAKYGMTLEEYKKSIGL